MRQANFLPVSIVENGCIVQIYASSHLASPQVLVAFPIVKPNVKSSPTAGEKPGVNPGVVGFQRRRTCLQISNAGTAPCAFVRQPARRRGWQYDKYNFAFLVRDKFPGRVNRHNVIANSALFRNRVAHGPDRSPGS